MNLEVSTTSKNIFKNMDKKKVFLIGGIIVVLGIVIFFLVRNIMKGKNQYPYENISDTSAFFLQNREGYYALFNEDGKQLSNFIFDSKSSFYGGVAKVSTKDGMYGIVREDGKYLVELSNHYISNYQSIFSITTESPKKSYVVNYKGDKVLEGAEVSIHSFYDAAIYYVEVKANEKAEVKSVQVLNHRGDIIDTIPNKDYFTTSTPSEGYTTLSDGEKTYVYNIDKGKKVAEVEGGYCVSQAYGNVVILSSCSSWYSQDTANNYVVLDNGRKKYTMDKSECNLSILEDGTVVCYQPSGENAFVKPNGELSSERFKKAFSSKNYVVEENGKYTFYANGKKEKTVGCASISFYLEDGYILRNRTYGECASEESGYAYYNVKGEKVSDTFYSATIFDDNGLAIVSTDSNNYYLMNSKYKKITDAYTKIRGVGNLYVVTKNQNNMLMDKEGKIIAEGFHDFNSVSRHQNQEKFVSVTYDDKTLIYDGITGKEIGEVSGTSVSLEEHYYVYGDHYYSYNTGKEFYTN